MTGRGIDQILPFPSEPTLHESALRSATSYVELAERLNGPIAQPVDFAYIWGDALDEIRLRAPDLRLVNLETSITESERHFPKGINYRMHPANVSCLVAAGIDCCALANNHVVDWGTAGLLETITTLRHAGIATAGAGRTASEAAAPAVIEPPNGRRVLVFGFGSVTSGIPPSWAASTVRPGVNLLADLSQRTAERVASHMATYRQEHDLVIVSLHWGDNWGYAIPDAQQQFARHLIDAGVADVIHGHSCHHAKGMEVYKGRLVLYGCGDFINDYEGIGGYEHYRPDLALAYFADIDDTSGNLTRLEMVAFQSDRFRLRRAGKEDAKWLQRVLTRECRRWESYVQLDDDRILTLGW
jgi:poly-gamma-glutamate synthesis protein (capsule biosynthesis protein)